MTFAVEDGVDDFQVCVVYFNETDQIFPHKRGYFLLHLLFNFFFLLGDYFYFHFKHPFFLPLCVSRFLPGLKTWQWSGLKNFSLWM